MSLIDQLTARIYEALPWDRDYSDSENRVLSRAWDTSFKLTTFKDTLHEILTDALSTDSSVLTDARAAANLANETTRILLDRETALRNAVRIAIADGADLSDPDAPSTYPTLFEVTA